MSRPDFSAKVISGSIPTATTTWSVSNFCPSFNVKETFPVVSSILADLTSTLLMIFTPSAFTFSVVQSDRYSGKTYKRSSNGTTVFVSLYY